MGVPLIVAVPFPLSVKLMVPGSVPVNDSVGFGFPVVVMVKLPATPTVNDVLLLLVMSGAEFTVTVAVDVTVAGVLAVFVTVSVYVVVVVGEMLTGVPLVTGPTP